ncbi:MAG: glycosyltransferase family 4 protein [Vulcanimicrobiota bacterium]
MKHKRIRVLQLIDILKGGGAEEWLKDLSRLIDRDRFEIKVCYLLESPQKTYIEEITKAGIKVIYIGLDKRISQSILGSSALSRNTLLRSVARHSYIFYALTKLHSLYKTIVKERIEIIHTHLHYSFLLASLLHRSIRIPIVCQVPQMKLQTEKTSPWSFTAYKFFGSAVDTFYTNISREELMKYGRIPEEKIQFIKGVVDLSAIRPVKREENPLVEEFGLHDAFPVFISIGRFVPEKGHSHAIEVATRMKAQFPRLKLLMLGEGWELEKYREIIKKRGLEDTVIMPGYRRDLNNFYSIADIFLRTCLIEGGSLANYYAMAYGNPIVAFETNAPTETITHGKNGFLAPLGDVVKMTEYATLLAEKDDLRKAIGSKSRAYANEKLDIRDTIQSIESDYIRLCNGKGTHYRSRKNRK